MAQRNAFLRVPRSMQLRPLALSLVCLGLAPALALAQVPTGFLSIAGGVSVATPNATTMNITQSTPRAIAGWTSFSIGAASTVNVAQPSSASVLLNRVTGGEPSTIAGKLNANGHVYLINPSGVLFTAGSSVNVGGLVASTLDIGNDAFMAGGKLTFERADGNDNVVSNNGALTASGGPIVLMGAEVANGGTMVSNGGTVGLVSGRKVTLDVGGDGLTNIVIATDKLATFGNISNNGLMQADGGRVVLMGNTSPGNLLISHSGVVRARSLVARNGEIILSGGINGTIETDDAVFDASGLGPGQRGGSIDITAGYVALDGTTSLDARGAAGGGSVFARALGGGDFGEGGNGGVLAVDTGVLVRADATAAGAGGSIRLLGDDGLRAFGSLTAQGGPLGGNGGRIETSAPAMDITGLRANASAAAGTAGTWVIDPFNVTIAPGAATGTILGDPFAAVAPTALQDGDISAALNTGTNVTITTGAATAGPAAQGDIVMNPGVRIAYTADKGPLTFELDAHRSVSNAFNAVISSSGVAGPLNVVFNANADGASTPVGGGQVNYNGSIFSNGGNVAMSGAWSAATGGIDCSICLSGPVIDTRAGNKQIVVGGPVAALLVNTGGLDTSPGGAVTLTGRTTSPVTPFAASRPGVYINDTKISSSTGNVTVFGSSTTDSGVGIIAPQNLGGIYSTSGKISLTGIGSPASGSSLDLPGHGVLINGGTLQSVSGDIAVHGLRQAGAGGPSGAGVLLQNGALVTTLGSGNIELTGAAQGNGAGVSISPFVPPVFIDFGEGEVFQIAAAQQASRVDGNNNVVLRASNNGSTDALVLGGTVRAANVLNLRPGGVDALGNAADRVGNPITLGGAAATGFAVSADEFTRISAGTIVAGSNAHAGNIDVVGPLAMANPLTLQNGGGGNITLGASVSAPQLGLLSAGNITQAAGAPITAGKLLARSSGGNVLLNNPANNVSVDTVAGGAAGRFEYVDADAVTLGPVSVTGFDAAGNLPQVVSVSSMAADTVLVRTLSGDLSLASNVSSTRGTDLVAGAHFQNLGAHTITGGPFRVWADSWFGEARGGLAGSGPLPNLYHCAFLGLCTVAAPADNHFIYAQQPSATVLVGSATRPFGFPNPLLTYSISGLILGDTGAGFSGIVLTPATVGSLPGVYPISGSFSSAEGYAINVVPGSLLVRGALDYLPKPDVLRDLPTTWLYDRNIGRAPICLASGPLEGERTQQGNDALAREWSRVRSRPNLISCVDTERRNGCADF